MSGPGSSLEPFVAGAIDGATDHEDTMALKARLTVKGGWIDVGYDGGTLTLAAVGSPLHYLVKPPTSIPARHKQSEEKGRFRRLAVEAIVAQDPAALPDDAEIVWSWRNG